MSTHNVLRRYYLQLLTYHVLLQYYAPGYLPLTPVLLTTDELLLTTCSASALRAGPSVINRSNPCKLPTSYFLLPTDDLVSSTEATHTSFHSSPLALPADGSKQSVVSSQH